MPWVSACNEFQTNQGLCSFVLVAYTRQRLDHAENYSFYPYTHAHLSLTFNEAQSMHRLCTARPRATVATRSVADYPMHCCELCVPSENAVRFAYNRPLHAPSTYGKYRAMYTRVHTEPLFC